MNNQDIHVKTPDMCTVDISAVMVAVVTICILFFSFAVFAENDPTDSRGKKIRVGMYDNPPKIYQTKDGRAAGLFADLLRHIARKESWELEFVPGTWEQGLDRLASGDIDVMPDVA